MAMLLVAVVEFTTILQQTLKGYDGLVLPFVELIDSGY